jgi:hypothetical protein
MKVNNYPVKVPSAGDRLFGSDSYGDQKQFDMSAVSSNVFQYEIGQYVEDEGGVIFHRWLSTTAGGSPTTGVFQNYLVLSLEDVSNSLPFSNDFADMINVDSLWDGETNTINLVNIGVTGGIVLGTAAFNANNFISEGFDDWYLPAIDELVKIYNNRLEISQGLNIAPNGVQLTIDSYWSSTQKSDKNAWFFYFADGSPYYTFKNSSYYVRAIRKFSI